MNVDQEKTVKLQADNIDGVYVVEDFEGALISEEDFFKSLKDNADDEILCAVVGMEIAKKIDREYGIHAKAGFAAKYEGLYEDANAINTELPAYTPDPEYAAQIKGLREMTDAINSGLLPPTTPEGVKVVSEGRHIGSVVKMEGDYAIQDVGRGNMAAHPLSRFDSPPEVGKKMDVSYLDGLAKVAKVLSQDEHAVAVSINTR